MHADVPGVLALCWPTGCGCTDQFRHRMSKEGEPCKVTAKPQGKPRIQSIMWHPEWHPVAGMQPCSRWLVPAVPAPSPGTHLEPAGAVCAAYLPDPMQHQVLSPNSCGTLGSACGTVPPQSGSACPALQPQYATIRTLRTRVVLPHDGLHMLAAATEPHSPVWGPSAHACATEIGAAESGTARADRPAWHSMGGAHTAYGAHSIWSTQHVPPEASRPHSWGSGPPEGPDGLTGRPSRGRLLV